MSDFNVRTMPHLKQNMPKGAVTDLYRAKYGLPLEGETHERFIATKVPYRKNKDYRPRFRNYSFGYPTYKKDNYTRHWYNFLDIMASDAPGIKYPKVFLYSYFTALIYNVSGGYSALTGKVKTNPLEDHKKSTAVDYTKHQGVISGLRSAFSGCKAPSTGFAVLATAYAYVYNKLQEWQYSKSQAHLRTCFLLSPLVIIYRFDRPFTNFWYRSTFLALFVYTFMHTYNVNKHYVITGKDAVFAEKFYLKDVTPQEIAKIEYEEKLLMYGKMFETSNVLNMDPNTSVNPKYSVISP